MTDLDWRDRASCRTTDPNVMQPERALEAEVAEAMELCTWCPVRTECLAAAEAQQSSTEAHVTAYGVWGGKWFGEPPARPARPARTTCAKCDSPVASTGQRLCRPHLTEAAKASALALIEVNAAKPCAVDGCTELRYRMRTQVAAYCKAHKRVRAEEARKRREQRSRELPV